ncbi:MAG: hypothetical protein WCJ87_01260 [Burkholderiales bacterium]
MKPAYVLTLFATATRLTLAALPRHGPEFSCAPKILARRRFNLLVVVIAPVLFGLRSGNAGETPPALPPVDLIVQVRMISNAELAADEAALSASGPAAQRGLSVSSTVDEPASSRIQEIRVRNGEHASMSWSQALPIQWLQAAELRGQSASAARGGIVNGLLWLHAGQSLSVQPSWPGVRHQVRVSIGLMTQSIGDEQGLGVPSSRSQMSSATLSVPLNRWTTFAATGAVQPLPDRSAWSTQVPQARARQLMQLRVMSN